jgi:UDP-glucose 4-epimerase
LLTALERVHLPAAVVLASTGAVYLPSPNAHRETSPLGPDDVYGHSKLWSEQAVRLWEPRTGVSCGIARLFNVIGPGETNPHIVPEIIEQAAHGDELRLGNLDSRRDYVFVDDVATGLQALAGHSATVNLGSGEAVDGHTLVEELGRALGRSLSVLTNPESLRPTDRPVLLSDPSAARNVLGWTPATPRQEALAAAARG